MPLKKTFPQNVSSIAVKNLKYWFAILLVFIVALAYLNALTKVHRFEPIKTFNDF